MRFFKILNKDDIKVCLKSIEQHAFKDGTQTQQTEGMKNNTESLSIPDVVRKLIIDRFYDTHYVDSVYCPTRVSVNFYNKYEKDDFYNIHVERET
jgi:predicted 2-oxoglutarate/Fe(II)-dependent dioxygenase YbiX